MHYGGSQSLASRISSAVLQKNEGYAYLEQVIVLVFTLAHVYKCLPLI